jgi:hypothetical protein
MSSNLINIDGSPLPPNIGYYDSNKNNGEANSYTSLDKNLKSSCTITKDAQGIYQTTDMPTNISIPSGASALDVPYYKAKNGTLMDDLLNKSGNNKNVSNQIQYLTCQLANARNRVYDGNQFKIDGDSRSVKDIFTNNTAYKPYLIIIFLITMYLLMSGFFSSIDVVGNIFKIIDSKSSFSASYWVGLLLGLLIPVIVLCTQYTKLICANLDEIKNKKFDITSNPMGVDIDIPVQQERIDYNMLILFVIILYVFTALIFTLKRKDLGNTVYLIIISAIMFILAVFMYMLYAFIPFFSTSDQANIGESVIKKIQLFVFNQEDTSNISTNQDNSKAIKKAFLQTFITIFIGSILYFVFGKSNRKGFVFDFINGVLGSSAILVIPAIWVFNFVLGINYFYIYPIILIGIRFLRYAMMTVIYLMSERMDSLKDKFSEGLLSELENFKNFSPTWGLIGIDGLKMLINMIGYDNIFSSTIIENSDGIKNLSQNKYVSTGILNIFLNSSKNGFIYNIILAIITLILSFSIMGGLGVL